MPVHAASSLADDEVARFSEKASQFWDPQGPFRMLHDLAAVRERYILDQVCMALDKKPDAPRPLAGLRILDVGSGGGLIAEPLARLGADVHGIDPSAEAVATARAHAKKSRLSIRYDVGTAEDLARGGARYDVITAMEVVEHVADLDAFVGALGRLLSPGGVLIVSSLNRTRRAFLWGVVAAEYILSWVAPGTHQWHRFVKPSEMADAAARAGMAARDVTGLVFHPIRRRFVLNRRHLAVNYFMTLEKPASKRR